LKVPDSEREQFERQHGWTIKKMETEDQTLVQECIPENLDPAPIKDEYAPVIFSQETVSHIVSIDMMSGKVCFIWLMVLLIHFTTFHLIKQRTQTYYNSFSSEKKPRLLVIGALESC
jgi:hypothetical protein